LTPPQYCTLRLTPPVSYSTYIARMSRLLRYYEPGQTVFITCVTAGRKPILTENTRLLLRATITALRSSRSGTVAWTILPDHFHAVIRSPDGDIPRVMQTLKRVFAYRFRLLCRSKGPVWQRRYWDHIIRNDEDLERCVDYVHYNPVKHGYVNAPEKWKWSSFKTIYSNGYTESGAGLWVMNENGADWGE